MEKLKERILSYTKIPLILSLPDKIDKELKEDYINAVKESTYFYLVEENVNFCEMLKPLTLIIGYSLEESSDTYILPVNSTKESFFNFLKNIFETEIEKNKNFKEKGFFKVFKKPDENSLKNEADSHFLTKNYIKAYEKYSNATNLFTNLHFQEMKFYCSLLLNEKLDTSFLFYKSFINTKRQFRIIDILILFLKIKEEFIFKIVQSVSLMKESEEKYYFIERLFGFRSNLASHLYYEYLVFVCKDRKYNEVKEYFDVFESVLENNQNFLTERMKSFFKNIKEKSLCN